MTISIYHNPRCSKSRQTLELLRENKIEPEIIEYLKNPPTIAELTDILAKLSIKPQDLMRKGEAIYKDLDLKNINDNNILMQAMIDNPILIERPIVIANGKAKIGRPPESVLDII